VERAVIDLRHGSHKFDKLKLQGILPYNKPQLNSTKDGDEQKEEGEIGISRFSPSNRVFVINWRRWQSSGYVLTHTCTYTCRGAWIESFRIYCSIQFDWFIHSVLVNRIPVKDEKCWRTLSLITDGPDNHPLYMIIPQNRHRREPTAVKHPDAWTMSVEGDIVVCDYRPHFPLVYVVQCKAIAALSDSSSSPPNRI